MVVVAGRHSKWARSRRLILAELAEERWVLPPADTIAGILAAEWFRAVSLKMPPASVTTLSIHLCCRLASTGQYVTTLPMSVLRGAHHDRLLRVLPIKLPVQLRPVGIVTLKNRTLSPVAKRFIECVHHTAKQQIRRSKH